MKIFKVANLVILSLLLGACSKPPKPVELEGTEAKTINQSLIEKHSQSTPQDPFLKTTDWTYNMYFSKQPNGDLIKNDDIVKAFYLAHNADEIIIIGDKSITWQYKNYFIKNGVSANIKLHPIAYVNHSKQSVNVLFFHKVSE